MTCRRDRGVSEVLGFALSFSIIMLSVGLVYTAGIGAVTDLRDGERVDSAQRALESTAATFENLQRGDPARSSELRIGDGSFSVESRTTFNVTVVGPDERYDFTAGTLHYEYGSSRVSYELGAVIRSHRDSGAVVRRPPFRCSGNQAVISVVSLRGSDRERVAGGTSVTVLARVEENGLPYPPDVATSPGAASAVNVSVASSSGDAWQRYFEDHPGWTRSGGGYVCSADRVFVRHTVIRVRLLA